MQWGRATVVVLLLVGAYALVAPLDVPVDDTHGAVVSADDSGYRSFSSAAAIARGPDGGWWVLEQTIDGPTEGGVYRHGSDWEPTDRRHGISLPAIDRNETVRPTDLHLRPDGGWYVLGENSVVYVYDAEWNDTGRRIVLPRREEWPSRRAHTFDRAADGWWVDAHGRLTLYDEEFSTVRASYDGYDDLALGEAYYNRHYGHMTVGDIRTIHVDGDSLVLQTSLADHLYRFDGIAVDGLESTTPDAQFEPDSPPPYLADVEDGPDGERYLLRRDGTLYVYTDAWIYTGTARVVGSGSAVDRHPSDVVTLAPFVAALFGALERLLPTAYLLVALAILRRRDRSSPAVYTAATASALIATGFFFAPHPLRPFLVGHRVALVVGLAVIVGGVAAQMHTEREDAIVLALVYLPVLYPVWRIATRLV